MNDLTTRADANMRERLLRLMMSALDFRHSLSAATFLLEDCDWLKSYQTKDIRRFRCYETTMVVAYGRPLHMRGDAPRLSVGSRSNRTLRWSLAKWRSMISLLSIVISCMLTPTGISLRSDLRFGDRNCRTVRITTSLRSLVVKASFLTKVRSKRSTRSFGRSGITLTWPSNLIRHRAAGYLS